MGRMGVQVSGKWGTGCFDNCLLALVGVQRQRQEDSLSWAGELSVKGKFPSATLGRCKQKD